MWHGSRWVWQGGVDGRGRGGVDGCVRGVGSMSRG